MRYYGEEALGLVETVGLVPALEAADKIPLSPPGGFRDHVQHDQFPVMGAAGLSLTQIQRFPCGHPRRLPSIRSTSRNSPLVAVQMPISTKPQAITERAPPSRLNWGLHFELIVLQ